MKIHKNLKTYFLIIFCLLGSLGSIVFGLHPVIGSILILLGCLSGIYSIISSKYLHNYYDNLFNTLAKMVAAGEKGNIYTKSIQNEIEKTSTCINIERKLQKALEINPNDIEALSLFCGIYTLDLSFKFWLKGKREVLNKNDIDYVKSLIQKGLKLDPEGISFNCSMGVIYDIEGKHSEARKYFLNLLNLTNEPYYHAFISTSWAMSGDNKKALSEIETAVAKGAKGWVIDYYLGRAYYSIGKFKDAFIYLKKAEIVNKYCPPLLKHLEDTYYYQGNFFMSAIYLFRLFFLLFFSSPIKSIFYLYQSIVIFFIAAASTISKKIWSFTKKISCLKKLQIKFFPPTEPETTLGEMMIEKGFFEYGIYHYENARIFDPNNIRCITNLAGCYYRIGDKPRALELCDLALSIDPTNKYVKYNKTLFAQDKVKKEKIIFIEPNGKYSEKEIKNDSSTSITGN